MKETKVQPFKIQRSIHTNADCPQMLIYNEDRSVYDQIDLPENIAEFMGGELKVYVRAFIDESGILQIVDRLKEQDW